MITFSLAKSLSISVRFYRTLLVAYPKTFREHYGTQMIQVFRDSFREAYRHHGMTGVIDVWLHTFLDLVFTALMERISEGSQHMFSPKVILWGGVASAFGGVMWLFPVLTAQGGEITLPLALLFTLGGMAALHARHGKQAGALGWAGFVLGMLGTGLVLAFFVWQRTSGNSLNSNSIPGLQFVLGIPSLGIGAILIGLRALQTKILPRSSAMLSVVIGILQIGFGFCVWLMLSLTSDPWNPMTIPAIASLLLMFAIGILWLVLGAIIAGDVAGLQTSNHPPASA